MAIKKKLYKSRLDQAIEELDNSVYVVEENGKKVSDPRNTQLPLARINNALTNYSNPVKKTSPKKTYSSDLGGLESKKKDLQSELITLQKTGDKNEWWSDDRNFFENLLNVPYKLFVEQDSLVGEDLERKKELEKELASIQDQIDNYKVENTKLDTADKIGTTITGNLKTGLKGIESTVGKVTSTLLGADFDNGNQYLDIEEKLAQKARQETNGIAGMGLDVLGSVSRMLPQMAVGNPTGAMAMGFANYGGGAYNEAKREGATEEQATLYGVTVGTLEMTMEKLLGGFESVYGKSAAGNVTNKIMGKVISNQAFRKAASGMAGEFTEEYLQEFLEPIVKNVILEEENGADFWNTMKDDFGEGIKQLSTQLFNTQNLQAGLTGALTSGIVGAPSNYNAYVYNKTTGRDLDTGYTQNEQTVIDSLVEEHTSTIAKKNALENELNKAITAKEAEQGGILSTKEKNAIREQIQAKIDSGELDTSSTKVSNKEIAAIRELIEEQMQKGQLDTNKIDSILGNTITENDSYLHKSYYEQAQKGKNFTYENEITNEQEKAVYESAAKYFNNTTRSHEFVEKVATIAKDKGTNYGFINNEELKSLGHDVEGKQVNGLVRTNAEGKQTVLINIDSPKALNTIVGHETTHLLEGTQEYADLQEAIFNYAKDKGDYNDRLDSLKSLYEGIDNANVDAELTADLVGDYLFTDEAFINNLSTQKPTVFQKIKELIDDLVVKFTGTKEEKALREVQKKFKEAYKKNVASKETNTKYSLISDKANKTYVQEMNKEKAKMMKERGYSDEKIWLATGYQYNNGKWQTEVNDARFIGKQSLKLGEEYRLADVVDAPEIFAAYPQLMDVKISKTDFTSFAENEAELEEAKGIKGATTKEGNIAISYTVKTRQAAEEVLNHEIQHLIQDIEGIETNTASYLVQDKNGTYSVSKEAMEEYLNSIAEKEARQVQNRTNMSQEERRTTLPKQTTTAVDMTRYSLTDNQGRTLTKEQQEYFKDSKVRDSEGRLLEVYNGEPEDFGNTYKFLDKNMQWYKDEPNTFGFFFTNNIETAKGYANTDYDSNGVVKNVYLDIKNPLDLRQLGTRADARTFYTYLENAGIERIKQSRYSKQNNYVWKYFDEEQSVLANQIKNAGYDGVIFEEGNDISYVVFNSNQIKNIDNTNPTSDADIRYSLTPDYGMSHRPSTDYGDASNFEENMPDVFEHPEWYMFGGDGWYKKAYKESWNALKKVRNNPDGEITIYRATIGDSFNEGDWVSPSKAYAEWHNYSNLEGKGKVIELKVKAKDIRFAGDDLNEFGYFPNGVDEYSLSRFNEQRAEAKGDYNVYGEDVKLQQAIAPLQEEIAELTETISELKEQLAPVEEVSDNLSTTEIEYTQPSKAELDNLMALQETGGTEYANTFFELRDKYGQPKLYKGINEYKKAPDTYEAPIKGDEFAAITEADLPILEQQYKEAFNSLDESNLPVETEDSTPESETTETKSLFEIRDYDDVGNRKVNAYQYDNPEVKPFFQEEAEYMLGDLKNSVKGERSYNDDLYYATNGEQGYFGTTRQTTDDIAELLDGVGGKYKYTYAEIEKGLNAIIKDEGAENNAVSKRIEFYLDQRLREGYTSIDGTEIPANQDYINLLKAREFNDFYSNLPIDDSMMPVENVDNVVENVSNSKDTAPTKKLDKSTPRITEASNPEMINKGYQLTIDGKAEKVIDNSTYKEIADVLVNEPKTESDRNNRKWAIFKANVFDKGIVFEDLALKENNRELIAKWDYTLTSEARGQYVIGNGHNGLSKSLNDIRTEVENTGLTKDFYNYMYHKHNVDRMTLDKRFGTENKPVFGESVTAQQSQEIVNQYEKTHPEFIDFAQDVYDYVNADKQQLVDSGVISQETADLWTKMYPHYVPTRRTTDTGIDINVPLDTRKTGINSPIKKATGGSSDILPLFDTMAMRTLQTYRATAKNSFGVELMNTMGTKVESAETNVDEVIDSIDAQDGLLQEGEKGKNPTFTVFDGGEKVTFEITKDMYDALKPVSESSLLSKTIKPLNVAGNIRRGLLTEYNPTFMLTNAIKDVQDVLLNSQHAARTYSKIPEAYKQIATKGYWYQEYVRNGGEQNSYFDNESNTFKTENKGLAKILDLPPLSTISKINNYIEMSPRLAEYIASREAGRSIEVSMLDAARVTTNFKAGGAITKALNRNGFTFLNASVQGAMQQVRNVREAKANGVRGWVNLATKFAIAGLPAILLNGLIWDDDEEYEELSDYVKQNYYIIGKTDDGTFIRIPKGRAVAVIQEGLNQMGNLVTGDDEVDLKSFIDLTINNLAPNNPLDNNIFSPIAQVAQNKTWYGGDLVPQRLQDMPAAEQYDESTDMLSRWIGETFNVSPYKVNYLLDQYSGGVGDVLLPMITPEATSDAETLGEHLLAPFKSKFTTNSIMNNQYISDLYDLSEELTTSAKKSNATDEDVIRNKYINSVKAEMNELYKEKREIQNSDLSKKEKYEQVLDIQSQINELAENALSEYDSVSNYSNYSTVGDREYYKRINSEGQAEWTKINEEEVEDLNNLGLTNTEKNTYFKAKEEISSILADYKDDKTDLDDLDEDSDEYKEAIEELSDEKKAGIIDKIKESGLNDEQKAYLYGKYYSSDKTLEKVTGSGISFDDFLTYHKDTLSLEDTESKTEYLFNADLTDEAKTVIYETSVLSGFDNEDKYADYKMSKAVGIDINSWLSYKKQEFKANKNSAGESIRNSRKNKIISYVNSLDLSIPQKAILIRQEYSSFDNYNNQIVKYVDGLDISYEEKVSILEGLDMTVYDDGTIGW